MKTLSTYKELYNTNVAVTCTDGRIYTGEWTGWELPTEDDPVPENIILELSDGEGLFALYAKEIESMAAYGTADVVNGLALGSRASLGSRSSQDNVSLSDAQNCTEFDGKAQEDACSCCCEEKADHDSAGDAAADLIAETSTDAAMERNKSCCCRHTDRSEKEVRDLISRLNRIEGQIRGIRGMVENDSYCIDILTQVSAASAALNGFSRVLMANHIKSCVANDIKEGREDKLDELLKFLPKMMK